MEISIELHGQLSPGSTRRMVLEMSEQATARLAALRLGLNPEEVGLIVINGVQSEMEDALLPGCRLSFFPYVSGG
jgi:hypothetical protein